MAKCNLHQSTEFGKAAKFMRDRRNEIAGRLTGFPEQGNRRYYFQVICRFFLYKQ